MPGEPRRLPHPDRQPRGRDAARAVGAARGRRGGLRGHAPHPHAARPLRREREARQLPRAQRGAAGRRAGGADAGGPRRWRWSPTPACRSCPTPATCSCGPAWPRGCRWRCCPGPSAAIAALVASALPADRLALRGLPARASRASCARCSASRGGTLVAFESPRRVPARSRCSPSSIPQRPVAVCRELTKVHEEVVRGTAAELAERYAGAPPKGEVVLVLGPSEAAAGAGTAGPAGLEQLRRWWRRAPSRAGGRGRGRRADRRQRQRALPRAHRVTIQLGAQQAAASRDDSLAPAARAPVAPSFARMPRSHAVLAAVTCCSGWLPRPGSRPPAWAWPVEGEVITPYRNGADPYAGGQHRGIDIAAAAGTPVVAAAGGHRRASRAWRAPPGSPSPSARRTGASTRPTCTCRRPPCGRATRVRRATGWARSARAAAARPRRRTCTSAFARPAAATPTATRSTSSRRFAGHRRPRRRAASPVPVGTPVGPAPAPAPVARPAPARRRGRVPERRPLRAPVPAERRVRVPAGRRVRAPGVGRLPGRSPTSVPTVPLAPGRAPDATRSPDRVREPERGPGGDRVAAPAAPTRDPAANPADRAEPAGEGPDLGWAIACVGLLLAAACIGGSSRGGSTGSWRAALRVSMRPHVGRR